MREVKLLNYLLWGFNLLLGVGIALFAVIYLLIQKPLDPLDIGNEEDLPPGPGNYRTADYRILRDLPLPVVKGAAMGSGMGTVVTDFNPKFLGGWGKTAYIEIGGKNALAEMGLPISYMNDNGDEVQIRGWTMVALDDNSATFRDGERQVVARLLEGLLEESGPVGPGRRRNDLTGKSYDPSNYKTRLRPGSAEAGRPEYEVDPDEAAWAQQNIDAVLENDVRLNVYGGGGLIVESVNPGSIAEARGIKSNDVVKSVSGIPVTGLADLKKIQTQLAGSRSNTMTLEIERAGRVITVVYKTVKSGR